jgi:hypothetical protein
MPTDDRTPPLLMSRALLLYFVIAFLSMTSFYLLLSVVPLYATSMGAGRAGAGFTTGALMLTTVATELATPALLARFGYRLVLAAGLVLLGAPALVLTVPASLPTILAVSLVRRPGTRRARRPRDRRDGAARRCPGRGTLDGTWVASLRIPKRTHLPAP